MQQTVDIRLLESAIDHFGDAGLHGASTRAIARDADTLMSSITYHFGGKEGLYLAVADYIAGRMTAYLEPMALQVEAVLAADPGVATARRTLHMMMAHMTDLMVRPEMKGFARFIVREQSDPTEAFHRIYGGMMQPMLDRLAAMLMIVAEGRLTDRHARIRAITLIGQILVFRVARATVLRGTGWTEIGAAQSQEIKTAVAENIDAILDQLEAGGRT